MGPEAESAVARAALDGAEAVAPRAASVLGSLKRTRTRVVPPSAAAAAVEAVDEEAAEGGVVGTELSQLPRVVRGAVAAKRSPRSTAGPSLEANLEAGTGALDDTSASASSLPPRRAPKTRAPAAIKRIAPPAARSPAVASTRRAAAPRALARGVGGRGGGSGDDDDVDEPQGPYKLAMPTNQRLVWLHDPAASRNSAFPAPN